MDQDPTCSVVCLPQPDYRERSCSTIAHPPLLVLQHMDSVARSCESHALFNKVKINAT
jgi:hypothetical protein